ncbi:MAG: Ig-like domain-containing protein, partial [Patescibacteria group bacterium]
MKNFFHKNSPKPEIRNEDEQSSLERVSALFTRAANSSDTQARPGFKEALKLRLQEARQRTSMGFSFSWFQKLSPKMAAGGLTALVGVIVFVLVFSPLFRSVPIVYAQDNFTLTPESQDSLGVDPKTTFVLESKETLNMDFVKQQLKITPEVSFDLKQIDDHHVRVTFNKALDAGKVVRFLLNSEITDPTGTTQERPYAWAFQVKNAFHIVSSIPGNKTANVPLDTGIEVVFTHENVSVKDFEAAFSITPAVKGHVEKNRRSLVFVPEKLQPGTLYTVKIASSLHPQDSKETLGEERVIQFETDNFLRQSSLQVFERMVTVDPTAKPSFMFGYQNYYDPGAMQGHDLSVNVYRFPSYDVFRKTFVQSGIDSWRVNRSYKEYVPVSSLTSVGTFTPQIVGTDYSTVAEIPVPLQEGYYGALISENGQEAWLFIQSVSLSTTVVDADATSMVWAHDLQTKKPLANAMVRA